MGSRTREEERAPISPEFRADVTGSGRATNHRLRTTKITPAGRVTRYNDNNNRKSSTHSLALRTCRTEIPAPSAAALVRAPSNAFTRNSSLMPTVLVLVFHLIFVHLRSANQQPILTLRETRGTMRFPPFVHSDLRRSAATSAIQTAPSMSAILYQPIFCIYLRYRYAAKNIHRMDRSRPPWLSYSHRRLSRRQLFVSTVEMEEKV